MRFCIVAIQQNSGQIWHFLRKNSLKLLYLDNMSPKQSKILTKNSTFLSDHLPSLAHSSCGWFASPPTSQNGAQKNPDAGPEFRHALIWVWPVLLAHVLPRPQLIFPSKKHGFLEFYLNFQQQKSLKKSISPTFWIQILPNKFHSILLIKIFPTTPNAHSNIEIIQYSRTFAPQVQTSWNQAHAPLLVTNFPKIPRRRSEASQFGGSHNYKTK